MITFPGSKINLGLRILSRRADGYHDIETVICPVGYSDILEIVPSRGRHDLLTLTGVPVPGAIGENLCARAVALVRKKYRVPPLSMHLHKIIPPGSGLGGGSADSASTLAALNDLFNLGIGTGELDEAASTLGADCAFFIRKKPMLAEGVGNILSPVSIPGPLWVYIAIPEIRVSTAWAYAHCRPGHESFPVTDALRMPVEKWKDNLVNDFEAVVFAEYPEIGSLKEALYREGAVYASLSGSGSAVYGLFDSPVPVLSGLNRHFAWRGQLVS